MLTLHIDSPRLSFSDHDTFGFGQCNLPCYAGMYPGRTVFDEASKLVIAHVPKLDGQIYISGTALNFRSYGTEMRLLGTITYRNGLIDNIRLNVHLPMRWLIDQLGLPTCVMPAKTKAIDSLNYLLWIQGQTLIGISSEVTEEMLDLNGRAVTLWVSPTDGSECQLSEGMQWKGFAPWWRYRLLQAEQNQ